MSHNESYDFFAAGAPPPAKFPTPGTSVSGIITEEPQMSQQTDPSGELKTWQDGNPMMQLVVTLKTEQRDPAIEDDDGSRRVFIKGQMRNAVQTAVKNARAKGLDVGGTLTVTYTHDGERSNPAFSPPKQYEAQYVPPKSDGGAAFLGTNGKSAAAPTNLPPGMSAEVWAGLTPEAQAALSGIAAK